MEHSKWSIEEIREHGAGNGDLYTIYEFTVKWPLDPIVNLDKSYKNDAVLKWAEKAIAEVSARQ